MKAILHTRECHNRLAREACFCGGVEREVPESLLSDDPESRTEQVAELLDANLITEEQALEMARSTSAPPEK